MTASSSPPTPPADEPARVGADSEPPQSADWRARLSVSLAYFRRFGALTPNARLYLISNTIQSVTAGALGVVYTLFLSSLHYGDTFIGLTLFVGAIGGGAGILPASSFVRRYGWRTMLLWSDLIGGVAIAIQLLYPTRAVILLTTLGLGISVAIFLVLNSPFLAANSAPRDRAALFGLNNALAFLAAVVGSLLGGALPTWLATPAIAHSSLLLALRPFLLPDTTARLYQLSLILMGVIAVPSIIPVLFIRQTAPTPGPSPASGRGESRGVLVGGWLAWGEIRAGVRRGVGIARQVTVGAIGRFTVSQVLVGFGAGLFFPYLSLYFVQKLGVTTATFGALSAGLTVTQAVASLASAPLADRFGKVRASLVAQVASLPFLLALGGIPIAAIAGAAFLIRGGLMALTSAPLQAYLMEAVPGERRIVASNVYNVSYQVAWAIGAGLGGAVIAVGGFVAPMLIAAALYAASAVLLGRWFWRQPVAG